MLFASYALVTLWFIHGTPPTLEGNVDSVFDEEALCCEAAHSIMEGKANNKRLSICIFAAPDDPKHSPSVVDCEDSP